MDRNAYVSRLWSTLRSKQITPYAYLVGRAMVRMMSPGGRLWPSRACLAAELGCSERTVERAHHDLHWLGLLTWERRQRRWNRRDSNLYTLTLPKQPLPTRARTERKAKNHFFESSAAIMSVGSAAHRKAAAELLFGPKKTAWESAVQSRDRQLVALGAGHLVRALL